jgi:type IV pilus assembly protein PilE
VTRLADRHPAARGFTLIELCLTVAVLGIVTVMAWPSLHGQLQRARRADAITALTRMQFAQEQYRARFGSYTSELAALSGAGSTRSPEGLYLMAVADAAGDSVTLAARVRTGGPQQGDHECLEITLRLSQGLADHGPSGRCWNR